MIRTSLKGVTLCRDWYGDITLLQAVRQLYTYDDRWPGRATGYLWDRDGVLAPKLVPQPWPEPLSVLGPVLVEALTAETGYDFCVCCFQAYLDGTGCGWHHDREWGAQAILSLGVSRNFGMRCGETTTIINMAHGDLLVMPAGFQHEWEHCVPAENVTGERVSLVFRTI